MTIHGRIKGDYVGETSPDHRELQARDYLSKPLLAIEGITVAALISLFAFLRSGLRS